MTPISELRCSPLATLLDSEIVRAAHDAEPTFLAPVGAARVAADPEVDAVLGAVARDRDLMVHRRAPGRVLEDAALVVLERGRDATNGLELRQSEGYGR